MPPQNADRAASPDSTSFAGMLAALMAPKAASSQPWIDDLEDDVATLSYERALETHAQHKSSHPVADAAAPHPEPAAKPAPAAKQKATATGVRPSKSVSALEQSRKRASVTVRMSRAEFDQLQQRATEAGMTVSAYLRSCTFEAEALRAQVKQALAELRAAPQLQPQASAKPTSAPSHHWFRFLRPHAQRA